VQVSADGKRVGIAHKTPDSGVGIQLWDLTGEPKSLGLFEGSAFALSPSGKLLVTNRRGEIYDIASKKPIAKMPESFSHVCFRDEGTVAATTRSYDFPRHTKGKILIWDVQKNADGGTFEIPDNRFSVALPAKNGREFLLFMSNNKFEVECYDLHTKQLARTVKPEAPDPKRPNTSSGIWSTITTDGSVFGSDVHKMHFYDGETGKVVGTLPPDLWATGSGFLPGGSRYLAKVNNSEKFGLGPMAFVLFDCKTQKPVAVLTGHASTDKEVLAAGSADGKVIVSVSKQGDVLVYDASSVK